MTPSLATRGKVLAYHWRQEARARAMAAARQKRLARARAGPPGRRFKASRDERKRREAEDEHALGQLRRPRSDVPQLADLGRPYADETLEEAVQTSLICGIRHCILVSDEGAESRL